MPETLYCAACGSPVEQVDAHRALCSNKQCNAGQMFWSCGFCKKFTFAYAPDQMRCYNAECRLYMVRREACPDCGSVSLITFRGVQACINRKCRRNEHTIKTCGACNNKSVITAGAQRFCVKSDCPNLMRPIDSCETCGQVSFDLDAGRCRNRVCKMFDVKVKACPSCGKRARIDDPVHPQNGQCVSCGQSDSAHRAPERQPARNTAKQLPRGGPPTPAPAAAPPKPAARPAPEQPHVPISASGPLPAVAPLPEAARAGWRDATPRPHAPEQPMAASQAVPEAPAWREPAAAPKPGSGGWTAPPPSAADRLKQMTEASEEVPRLDQLARDREAVQRDRRGDVGTAADASILEAYEFVRDYVLSDNVREFPVILVIGLSGAGKTTYLSMLGEILRTRKTKYYFPHEGIDIRPVMVEELAQRRAKETGVPPPQDLHRYRSRIKDLVYDFAQHNYQSYIGRMLWCGATPREVPGEISTYFLVAELRRHMHTIAKIVTLETSGEDFEDVLRGIRHFDPGQETHNPLHRVLYELLDIAQDFVVLVSPDGPHNDEVFHDFFLMINDALQPRGLNVFREEVRERLMSITETDAEGKGGAHFMDLLRGLKRDREIESQREADLRRRGMLHADQLAKILEQLDQSGGAALTGASGEILREFEADMEKLDPATVGRVRDLIRSRGIAEELIVSYYKGLIPRIIESMPGIMRAREAARQESRQARAEDIPADIWEGALWDIRKKYGLTDSFVIAKEAVLEDERPVRRMRNLKHIAIAVTKSDMYPIICPVENFPVRMLPRSNMHLAEIENLLKLCGGRGVRYYNSSATGYSILRDTLYYPGKENTFTPINILEPIFDSLDLEA
jgi:hypothetical protein